MSDRDAGPLPSSASSRTSVDGEWVVTLDVEGREDSAIEAELTVRALSAAVAGSRTYVAARTSGYSFTAIVGTTGAEAALAQGLGLLAAAQATARLAEDPVVCAEVTLVGARPVPAGHRPRVGCENPAP